MQLYRRVREKKKNTRGIGTVLVVVYGVWKKTYMREVAFDLM